MICFFFGTVIGPLCQDARTGCGRTAPQQVAATSEIIDIAGELGHPPAGSKPGVCAWPFNQVFEVEFSEKTLALPQIPAAWDGATILHLSDLHFCGSPSRHFHRIVCEHAMKKGPPDLVAVTGDIVDSGWHHRWILPILGRVRGKDGQFAILGNHDHYRDVTLIRRRLRRAGFRVLVNSWEQATAVRRAASSSSVTKAPGSSPIPDLAGAARRSSSACCCRIRRSTDRLGVAPKPAVDLMLAGHVHGGQIRFPLIGSTFCPSRYSRRFDCGTFCAVAGRHARPAAASRASIRCECCAGPRTRESRCASTGRTCGRDHGEAVVPIAFPGIRQAIDPQGRVATAPLVPGLDLFSVVHWIPRLRLDRIVRSG